MTSFNEWLEKSEHDLKSAKLLASTKDPILDTAIFHTQQCAEKALKAFLAYKEQEINKTHDLTLLVELCSDLDSEFKILLDDADTLTPFATAFRYPNIIFEPDEDEVTDAIKIAENLYNFVRRKIT